MAKKKKKDPWQQPAAKFNVWVNNLYAQCDEHEAAWLLDHPEVVMFLALLTPYNAAYEITKVKGASTTPQKTSTNSKRDALTKFGRKYVKKQIFLNDAMDDEAIELCGLDPHDATRTKKGKPEFIPEMAYKQSKPNGLLAYHRQAPDEEGVSARGLPAGCAKVKVYYLICDKKDIPAEPDASTFPKSKTGARSPITIKGTATDGGRAILTAACYMSETDVEGDLSDVEINYLP